MNALEYAIKMELDGEAYYREQAALNANNRLKTVCNLLAGEEQNHAALLQKKMLDQEYTLTDSDMYSEVKNLFQNLDDYKDEVKKNPTQLDFYRIALEKEQESIVLYSQFLDNAVSKQETELFQFLISQEKYHFALIDELVTILRHTEEWVESPEFGLRIEEY